MVEYPPFFYFALAVIGPLMTVRGLMQLNNAAFLREWANNHIITVMDIWRTATYRLTISLAVLFIMKEQPSWIGDKVAIVGLAVFLFGGSAIYELIMLKSRVGKHVRTLPPFISKLTSSCLVVCGLFFTYVVWLHSLIFKQELIGMAP